jgi:hypothetical protein
VKAWRKFPHASKNEIGSDDTRGGRVGVDADKVLPNEGTEGVDVKRTRKTPAGEINRAQASCHAYRAAKEAKDLKLED